MDSAQPRRLGILGGMGPLATVHFYRRLIERTPAGSDQEHVPVAIWADPTVPDRTDALLGRGPSPVPAMVAGLAWLAEAHATCVAIPCNTAHAYVAELREHSDLMILDMVHAAMEACRTLQPGIHRVGVLATEGTRAARLYEAAGERLGIDVVQVSPLTQQRYVSPAIAMVKQGGDLNRASRYVARAAGELLLSGAEVAIAACTEIPVVMADAAQVLPMVDSTEALADAALTAVGAQARDQRRERSGRGGGIPARSDS